MEFLIMLYKTLLWIMLAVAFSFFHETFHALGCIISNVRVRYLAVFSGDILIKMNIFGLNIYIKHPLKKSGKFIFPASGLCYSEDDDIKTDAQIRIISISGLVGNFLLVMLSLYLLDCNVDLSHLYDDNTSVYESCLIALFLYNSIIIPFNMLPIKIKGTILDGYIFFKKRLD